VKILDFGLARAADQDTMVSAPGAVVGTPQFMSPEQAMGGELDARSDLFSLGAVLYRMAGGELPFKGKTPLALLMATIEEMPTPLRSLNSELPPAFCDLVMRLLAKQPAKRPQSAQEVADALGQMEETRTTVGAPRRATRHWMRWSMVAASVIAIGVLTIVLLQGGPHADDIGPPPAPAAAPLPARFTNDLGMEFALVPRGKAWLGGSGGKPGDTAVEFKGDFYLGVYEVSQEQWQKVLGNNPSHFSRTGGLRDFVKDIPDADLLRFPVDGVSWDDCQQFLSRLNDRLKETDWLYRLPTEAEWEYACRGGPMTDPAESAFDYYWTPPTSEWLPDHANIRPPGNEASPPGPRDGALGRTSMVGSFQKPNKLGLHDMHGNVWEWCSNTKPDQAVQTVIRGGSWNSGDASTCRATSRAEHGQGFPRPASAGFDDYGLRVARVRREPAPAKRLDVDLGGAKLEMAYISPGRFTMGSPADEPGHLEHELPHEVEITRGFYMGVHEVTVAQFEKFALAEAYKTDAESGHRGWGYDPELRWIEERICSWRNPGFAQDGRHPAVLLTWNDAVAFCQWLSRRDGKEYDLPTEAEWEYACRAGTQTRFSSGKDNAGLQGVCNLHDESLHALLDSNRSGTEYARWNDGHAFTAPAGSFRANAFGLCDMHGNAWEWCKDWFQSDYAKDRRQDPQGPATGTLRVMRGGSLWDSADLCRSAHRNKAAPEYRALNTSFRVVLRMPQRDRISRTLGAAGKLMDDLMTRTMAKLGSTAAVVAVERHGLPLHVKAYGHADREKTIPATVHTRFPVGNHLNMVFLNPSIRQLAEKGRLKLSDSVLKLFEVEPSGPVADERVWKITVQDLVNHTCGWDDELVEEARKAARAKEKDPPREMVLSMLASTPLREAPGTTVRTCGFCWELLITLLNKVAGKSRGEYFRHDLFGREIAGIADPDSPDSVTDSVWNAQRGDWCISASALLDVMRDLKLSGTNRATGNRGDAFTCDMHWYSDGTHVVTLFNGGRDHRLFEEEIEPELLAIVDRLNKAMPRKLTDVIDLRSAPVLAADDFTDPAKSAFNRGNWPPFENGLVVVHGPDAPSWGHDDHQFTDFACQVVARTTGDDHRGWGVELFKWFGPGTPEKSIGGVQVLLNSKGQLAVVPTRWGTILRERTVKDLPSAGPGRMPQYKPNDFNTLTLVFRAGQVLEVFVNGAEACEPITLPCNASPAQLHLASVGGVSDASRLEFKSYRVWSVAK
jgi:formylglycine-generating enzyme required for sulfatase activity